MKIIFLTSLILFGTFAAYGMDFPEENMETSESETKEEKQDNESKSEKKLQEFIPSEEVSIDKPVAFPVDI